MLSNIFPQAGRHQHKPLSLVCNSVLDKAPHLSIRIFIWILPSDIFVSNSTKILTETAMLPMPGSRHGDEQKGPRGQGNPI